MPRFTVHFQYWRMNKKALNSLVDGKRTVKAADARCAAAKVRVDVGAKWQGELFTVAAN